MPLADRPKFGKKYEGDETPEQEITMRTGDFLYLPRGVVHAASSNDEASIHLTIGAHQTRWASVLQSAMIELFDEEERVCCTHLRRKTAVQLSVGQPALRGCGTARRPRT
ncbi:JmjC domain-containing protein [Streptomyces sp. NPDC001153]